MFLVGGFMDLVCKAEQHRILLAVSVQLGRQSRALGVVCTSFGLFVGLGLGIGAWKVAGFWPLFHLVCGPFFLQALLREGFGGCCSQGCHGYPKRLLSLIRGLTLLSR